MLILSDCSMPFLCQEIINPIISHFYNSEINRTAHIKQMKEGRFSDKAGAGLGFLDMAKKTGNKFQYHIENVNSEKDFFILKTSVSKN